MPSRLNRPYSIHHRYATGLVSAALLAAVAVQPTLAQRSNPSAAVAHQQVLPALQTSTLVGNANAAEVLHIAVSLQPAHPGELEAFCDRVSDPASQFYGQFITPAQVGERFGASPAQVNAVVNHLKANGIKITLIAPNRMAVLADATVAQAQNAFQTQVKQFVAANPVGAGTISFHANTAAPKLPANIASAVLSVDGLEDYTRPMPRATTTLLNPTLTRGAYNTAPLYGAGSPGPFRGQGRTIAISNWDGFDLDNVKKYITQYGLPVPAGGATSNISVVTIDGGSQRGRAGGEADLDIQMEVGMAPLANIIIYDGKGGDLVNVLTREATDNRADVISESWGWSINAATATAAHNQHLAMTAQGITYMAASGDSGTSLEPYSYPNYDPEVLMVGGTVATVDAVTGVRQTEVGWSGSGGGWSTNTATFNTQPSYQLGIGLPNIGKRLCPDVALHASGNGTGAYSFYYRGKLTSGYVGTSFACPVFAGCLGVCESKLLRRFGRIQDLLYSQRSASYWRDITSGSNGKLPNGATSTAGTGWDYVTGWGAIDFNAFATANP